VHRPTRALAAGAIVMLLAGVAEGTAAASAPNGFDSAMSVGCGNGIVAQRQAIPTGFDPRTATAAELAAVDFPQRPTDPELLPTWQAYAAKFAAGKVDRTPTCDVVDHPEASAGPAVTPDATGSTSLNWAGNVDNANSYTDAEATWVVPPASGGSGAYSVHWVGVGLGNSSQFPLAQAGSWSRGDGSTFAWYEVFPQRNIIQATAFGSVTGHILFAHVTFNNSGGSSFHLVDQTSGVDRTYSLSFAGTRPDGHAEFIAERPTINGSLPALANFGTMTFRSAQAAAPATGWKPVGVLPHYYYVMTNSGGAHLATPGAISTDGTVFSATWHRAS
jgi:Peptidase A4 family